MLRRFFLTLLGLPLLAGVASATPPDARGVEFFETKIRPVLAGKCFACHSAAAPKVRGGLVLDTPAGMLKGGDNGPAVVPGYPAKSLLLKAMKHNDGLKMPPKEKLPESVVADFTKWIEMGAPDPRDPNAGPAITRVTLEDAKSFWSFKPVAKASPPRTRDAAWARTDVDRFVLAKLEEKGLKPVADADRRVLIRRLSFDLVGLPPTPREVEEFVNDQSTKAVEKVVDRLLGSPHFGERWGRYWLDVARYAESNGNADNNPFPEAWRYRDYVIAALNKDTPYDQFVREQIAGDLLPHKDDREKDQHLIATGFLALTSKPRAQNNPDYQLDLIADQIDVTSRAVLGLSVVCARCHDHKFDPVPTKEYYALAGIFNSSVMLHGAGSNKGGNNKSIPAGGLHALSDGGSAMGVKESKPTNTAIAIRGDSTKRGETPERGFLTAVTVGDAPKIPSSASGRLELAQWLTAKSNPLTARVAVNRVWMHLFGNGLVKTVDNFGALGERPSHPELLDHLAATFMDDGWSVKRLIRSLVLSRTYQLASTHDAGNANVDPDNVLLWRMTPRRLDAEAIRDAVLSVSGKLDLVPPTGSLAGNVPAKGKAPAGKDVNLRSVYLGIRRGAPLPEALAIFDAANPNIPVAQREVTTVPAQALYLLNSPWVIEQSKHFATRLTAESKLDDAGRIDLAYRLAFARPATKAETERGVEFVKGGKGSAAWAGLCQAILASAEFRYLE